MKVLFISTNTKENKISPIIKNQGDSLKKEGLDIYYYTIIGGNIKAYLKEIKPLKGYLKKNRFDIIHAHYSFTAFVASLAGAKSLVVSLMGSDIKSNFYLRNIAKLFNLFFWSKLIVKSEDMYKTLGLKNVEIIPNGVDFSIFKPIDKSIALKKTAWDINKKHILFAANPSRKEKNFKLAKDAFDSLNNNDDYELHYLKDIPNNDIYYYFNAANVILLTSLWEGSPNVIKEAMACNRPIVSTDVGDVKNVINNTNGCYICDFNKNDLADKIQKALDFNKSTNGREKIKHLEISIIANKILRIYKLMNNVKE